MSKKSKPVLLTGASGNLGRMLARELAAQGYTLRLTDLTPSRTKCRRARASPRPT
ncbi:hypothetical protein ACFQU7_01040 [Pseudoroseomonas wenyumeiae]